MDLAPLTGKQREAVTLCTSRINIFEGSVRAGKTVSSLLAWLRFVRTGPPGNLLMAGRIQDSLKRNCLDTLAEMLGPSRCIHNMGTRELHLLGRKIYLASANDDKAATKIAGLTLVGAYCDELSTWPASFFRMLGSRLSSPGARLYGTTNPDAPLHWLKTGYIDRARVHLTQAGDVLVSEDAEALDLSRLSFTLADNPYLPPDYIAALETEYTGLWRKRYVEGLWVAAEGAVFDMFDAGRHVVDICPVITKWLCCAVDYGTSHPLDAVLLGLGTDRRLYVVAEFRWDSSLRHRQLTDAEYVIKLGDWLASIQFPGSALHGVTPERMVIDPSALSFKVAMRQARYRVWDGDNDVGDGIRTVASLLATDRLKVHRSCTDLIGELGSYAWDEGAASRGEDKPVKAQDDAVDALRYAVFTTRQVWRSLIVPTVVPPNLQDTFGVAL